MLLLTRNVGQKIRIGDDITVTIAKVQGDVVTVWVTPRNMRLTHEMRLGHQVIIEGSITIRVTQIRTIVVKRRTVENVKIGIEAPPEIKIYREEIWQRIQAEGRKTPSPATPPPPRPPAADTSSAIPASCK